MKATAVQQIYEQLPTFIVQIMGNADYFRKALGLVDMHLSSSVTQMQIQILDQLAQSLTPQRAVEALQQFNFLQRSAEAIVSQPAQF